MSQSGSPARGAYTEAIASRDCGMSAVSSDSPANREAARAILIQKLPSGRTKATYHRTEGED
jgi:hypothetical protein